MARALLETVPRGNFAERGHHLISVSVARAVNCKFPSHLEAGLRYKFGRRFISKMSILRTFKFLMATVSFAAQGFGMENPHAQPPQTCCPIVELRQYTLHPGKRDVLIDLFDREFVESQEALGMKVIGQFRDLDDPNRFVWLRGFRGMPSRAQVLKDFYGGPVWKAHREAASATMIDSDNVLLLHPAM